jgi:hypothetical protein
MIRLADAGGGIPLNQLKITLCHSKPPIWRRVVVRADMTLNRLHHVIQIAMDWTNSHLHQFRLGRVFYGIPDREFDGYGFEMLNEKQYTVADLAPEAKQKFIYEYDFGDSWEHEIRVEKVLPPDPAFKHPVCLAGANQRPPEDCGGIPGYYNLLAILADPNTEEHEEMKEWVGGEWDPGRFDLEETNARLKRLKA